MIGMARFEKHVVINMILEIGLIPIFYHGDLDTAKKIVKACADGGAKVVEFTNRGDLAHQVFGELVKWCGKENPDVILGAGTITDPETAALYINNGANFIVSPILNPAIAEICNLRGILYIPGCGSLTEILQALRLGCYLVKVFPGKVVGPDFIRSVLGPYPWLKLMPMGGVEPTRKSISEWFRAGAAAVGMGSMLISKDLVRSGNFEEISKRVRDCLAWIKEVREDLQAKKG